MAFSTRGLPSAFSTRTKVLLLLLVLITGTFALRAPKGLQRGTFAQRGTAKGIPSGVLRGVLVLATSRNNKSFFSTIILVLVLVLEAEGRSALVLESEGRTALVVLVQVPVHTSTSISKY